MSMRGALMIRIGAAEEAELPPALPLNASFTRATHFM